MLSKNNQLKQYDNDLITLNSYNVKEYSDRSYETVKTLFQNSTCLLIQETWLAETEFIAKFKNDFPKSECISANKMDNVVRKAGRPYGGVGICYHSNIKCQIEKVTTVSKSICALKIFIGDICILLINVYMPCSDNKDALAEYEGILQEISYLCINNDTQHIIIGGDWNADLNRNDGRTKLFKDFISSENLFNPLCLELSNVPFTYSGPMIDGRLPNISTIDHFLISPNLAREVVSYEATDVFNNTSDHIPLTLRLNIDIEYHKTYERNFKPCVQWHKCYDNNIKFYRDTLDELLLKSNPHHEALKCKEYKCTSHAKFIQEIHNDIISSIS